jgi:hypothetical protein
MAHSVMADEVTGVMAVEVGMEDPVDQTIQGQTQTAIRLKAVRLPVAVVHPLFPVILAVTA